MNFQKIITTILLSLVCFSHFAHADEAEPTVVSTATFKIHFHSGGKLIVEDLIAGIFADDIACGKMRLEENSHIIPQYSTGVFHIDVYDPSCFQFTAYLYAVNENFNQNEPDWLSPFGIHTFAIDFYPQYYDKIELDMTDMGLGIYTSHINDNTWDMQENKTFEIDLIDITSEFLNTSKSTGTVQIDNRSRYHILINHITANTNEKPGNTGLIRTTGNRWLRPNEKSLVTINTSANGSAEGIIFMSVEESIPAEQDPEEYDDDENANIVAFIHIPVDVGPDYRTPTDEAFAADVFLNDDNVHLKATFDKTKWDGQRDKHFKLTITDEKS